MSTLWDTNGSAIVKELAAQRRTGGAVMSGVALTLVVIADEDRVIEAEAAAAAAAEVHPCRLLVVVRRQVAAPSPRLDAEVLIGGRLGPGEAVVMRMYGRLGLHAESVVLPLLAADAPVVTWWHAAPPDRIETDALGVIAGRRVTDSAMAEDALAALRARAEDFTPGDTDLAWTRSTPWRSALASTLDAVVGRRGDAVQVLGGHLVGDPENPTAQLVAGWLSSRCGCAVDIEPGPRRTGSKGIDTIVLRLDRDEEVRLQDDRKGGVVISQPFRPDSTVALPKRSLGELLGEEMRRLDTDEPYREALEAATGVTGLADRPATREHRWFDPMRPAGPPAPQVPDDSTEDDEVAQTGTTGDDDGGDDSPSDVPAPDDTAQAQS
ncbi:glucose-6-phosphate dehydrogenase assembly protein OpcA [Modestobacter sp. Leaf380]|uniref:glucose-6-phosphate dehydrogenase assembly protein OpcA n=1 Tax=Modestobacter sp. Leaf380 TaxID=1736356 RepID=UPI0009E78E0A|nr:glucose-6-phosphate dehydrogenase assembly protein OpcA [Modestobacter sp. Leaf380]